MLEKNNNKQDSRSQAPIDGLVNRAIRGRCPKCGKGRLFSGYLSLEKSCSSCGLSYSAFDAGDGPAFFVNAILCVVAGAISLILELGGGVSWVVHVTIWLVVVIGLTLLLLRPAKGLFVGLQNQIDAKSHR